MQPNAVNHILHHPYTLKHVDAIDWSSRLIFYTEAATKVAQHPAHHRMDNSTEGGCQRLFTVTTLDDEERLRNAPTVDGIPNGLCWIGRVMDHPLVDDRKGRHAATIISSLLSNGASPLTLTRVSKRVLQRIFDIFQLTTNDEPSSSPRPYHPTPSFYQTHHSLFSDATCRHDNIHGDNRNDEMLLSLMDLLETVVYSRAMGFWYQYRHWPLHLAFSRYQPHLFRRKRRRSRACHIVANIAHVLCPAMTKAAMNVFIMGLHPRHVCGTESTIGRYLRSNVLFDANILRGISLALLIQLGATRHPYIPIHHRVRPDSRGEAWLRTCATSSASDASSTMNNDLAPLTTTVSGSHAYVVDYLPLQFFQ
jgi:hypothetical protein